MDRSTLPYRKKTELFLLNENGHIVVADHGHYLLFPGGGVDEYETDYAASGVRELTEETGLTLIGTLQYLGSVQWDRFPARANNEKRKKRYETYIGEEVHIFVGKVQDLGLGGHEDDARSDKDIAGMTPEKCLERLHACNTTDHPNTYPYRVAQEMAIRSCGLLS